MKLGDKKEKKKKGIVSKVVGFFTLLSTLPFIFNIFVVIISLAILFVAAAGILQFFEEEDPIIEEYQIDWGNYTCSCTFLTAEQILQVQAGNQVEVDVNNGASLNITGGSVVTANGLTIPSMGALKEGVGEYGIPIWSGYSKADTGQDIVVGLSIDTRTETKMSTATKDTYESVVVNEYMAKGPVSRMLTGDLAIEDGRLCVALASGVIAWPDDPDKSSTMLGLDVDIVLKNGEVIPCRVKDAKANVHTGELHVLHCGGWGRKNNKYEVDSNGNPVWYKGDKSVIELYKAPNNTVASWLATYIKSVGGYDHAKVYNHGRGLDAAQAINPYSFDSTTLKVSDIASGSTSSFGTNDSTGTTTTEQNTVSSSNTGVEVNSNSLTYSNGQKIGLDSSWEYANESAINSGSATYYTATSNRKDICVAVNAGHGCAGGSSKSTKSHPDGTKKIHDGTNGPGEYSTAISGGTTFLDNESEASVNLKIAIFLKDELLSMGYDVLMIRESDDEQLDNIARTVIANNVADCHVSIHFDSGTSDNGAYYVRTCSCSEYVDMEPVKTWRFQHDELGEALLVGLRNNGSKVNENFVYENDLTQTSYSTIPSVDIELGDRSTSHEESDCEKFAKGLALGVDEFFKTHNPVNQSKRVTSSLNITSITSTTATTNTTSSTTGISVVNKNKNNLRTECSMALEGICGCYVSDPNCMCHIFAGNDGVLGNDDDNTDAINGTVQNNQNIDGLTTTQSTVILAAKEIMQLYLDELSRVQPSRYENGWTNTSGNPWYGQANSKAKWTFTTTINGKSYNSARHDCSSYVNAVLIKLGASFANIGYGTGIMIEPDYLNNVVADDKFILLDYDYNNLQPGDIILKKGHTEILYKIEDVENYAVRRFSWGSTGAVQSALDLSTREMLDVPNVASGGSIKSYYRTGSKTKEYIIRYVGSGGAGK